MDIPVLDFPVLSLFLIIPLVGAILTLFMGGKREKYAKFVATIAAVATLGFAIYMLLVDSSKYGEFTESHVWIEAAILKMNYILAIDGLSILMVFLTALLVLVVIIFSYGEGDRPNYFHTLLLAMEVGLMGVYLSADYFLFYIMWEVTLIPMFFMISWYGGPRRQIGRAHV